MRLFLAACFLVASTVVCLADQPACTGNRHYDGVGCCPAVDPPSTTTTTLDPGCPDPPPCQPVTCNDVTINIERCPAVYYKPCKMTKHGLRCPKPHYHGRTLAPFLAP